MPATGSRTPGFRFKDGKLMIFREDEVMLIQGRDTPSALRKDALSWEPFIPEFRLVAPYRRTLKPAAKNSWKPSEDSLPSPQLAFDLWDVSVSKKPPPPGPPPLTEQRKRAFDAFRFSLPKDIAKVFEGFRSHQWHLLVLLAHDLSLIHI